MKTRTVLFTLALALAPAIFCATMDGPRLGMVFDPAHRTLRPLLGIPGAAVLGQPVELDVFLSKAVVSPQQDYVLATFGDQQAVGLMVVSAAVTKPVALSGVGQAPDQMVLSAAGHAGALYYQNANKIQVLGGLPAAPKVAAEFYLSAGQFPLTLAVSDDAQTVLAALGHGVYWINAQGEVPVATGLERVSSIALAPDHTALIADTVGNRIQRVRNVTGTPQADSLAGSEQGISAPVAVAFSSDSQRGFVANGKSGMITILDLAGKSPIASISCGCKPTGLDRLSGNDVFRLTRPSNQPMWLFEAGGVQPRVVFVPADSPRRKQE